MTQILTGGGGGSCEFNHEDVETVASSDAVQHLGAAWRILIHVYAGQEPLEENVVCTPCFEFLKERGLNKGVLTPSGEVAKEFSDYLGAFIDAMQVAKNEDKPKIYTEWLKACPPFWRGQFEEESAWDEIIHQVVKKFPGILRKDDDESKEKE